MQISSCFVGWIKLARDQMQLAADFYLILIWIWLKLMEFTFL